MIRLLVLLLFITAGVSCIPAALAADGGETTIMADGTEVTNSGTCDWTALKNSLNETEASGKGCDFKGTGMSKYGAARGKYQFIEDTWNRMAKGCPNASQCSHGQMAYKTECCVTQECAMDNLLSQNMGYAKNHPSCKQLLGKTISGHSSAKGTLTCQVTIAGIIAAAHLGGQDVCQGILNGECGGNGDYDGGKGCGTGTSEAYYLCRHGGNPIPGECTPPPYDPNQVPPVGTIDQIRVREGQGHPVIVGSADGLKENWIAGLMLMAEQFTANMIYQIQMVAQIFDAKHQLETQRLFQQKIAEAHKDYQPSEQMCTFGTFARDLIATERSSDLTRAALSTHILQRELGSGDSMGISHISDTLSRLSRFRKRFCNPSDNANGLSYLCPEAAPAHLQNADIDFTQAIDQPLSLDINLTDDKVTEDEEVVFALIDNLFAHDPLPRLPADPMTQEKYRYHYMNIRSLAAMRGVARNSIANLVALKTATPNEEEAETAAPYLRALFRDFGLQDQEIHEMLGDNPSYYAQMELLTKKMYQSPSFYTNLYDKPANVARIRAAMQAIKLMQDRDIQDALLRREMLLSMMLEIRLRQRAEAVYSSTLRSMFEGN